MNSNSAKNRAINTTLGLIFLFSLIAFAILFSAQKTLALIEDNVSKGTEIFTNFLLTFLLIPLSSWLAKERVSSTVTEAIEIAAKELIKEERDQIENQRIKRIQEYSCAIPTQIRSSKIDIHIPSDVCINRAARDAIIKALADKDDLIREMASTGIQYALNQLDRDIEQRDNELFIDDIYAYLKAWLMFSVRYEYNMPIEYIKQRYRRNNLPDIEAYKITIEKIRDRIICPILEEQLDKNLTANARERAVQIIIDLLTELSLAIGNNHSNNSFSSAINRIPFN